MRQYGRDTSDVVRSKFFRDGGRFEVASGERFVFNGDIDFTEVTRPQAPGEYHSFGGVLFGSLTFNFLLNDYGLTGACRRLTCAREAAKAGLHEELRDNQFKYVENNPEIRHWIMWFRMHLMEQLPFYGSASEWKSVWANAKHPKRALRMAWLARNSPVEEDAEKAIGVERKGIQYKMKPGETLASGKYLRAIGDLGVNAASKLGYYMDWVKAVFEIEYRLDGCSSKFIKTPSKEALKSCFYDLINCEDNIVFRYFSDDSCLAVRCTDGVFMCNMDVSACDGSNFDPVFKTLRSAMSVDPRFNSDIKKTFAQLKYRCTIRCISNPLWKVVLQPIYMTLYSGSTLTTCVNNMAEMFMFHRFAANYKQMTKSQVESFLTLSAREAGFLVKIIPCNKPEELQFLKHSPLRSASGEYFPVMNYGVALRNFGKIVGDFPGRQSDGIINRILAYQSDVVKSFVHSGNTSFYEAFRTKFIIDSTHDGNRSRAYLDAVEAKPVMYDDRIEDDSALARYGATPSEYEEFLHYLRTCPNHGCKISCAFIDKVMAVDYGYEPLLS